MYKYCFWKLSKNQFLAFRPKRETDCLSDFCKIQLKFLAIVFYYLVLYISLISCDSSKFSLCLYEIALCQTSLCEIGHRFFPILDQKCSKHYFFSNFVKVLMKLIMLSNVNNCATFFRMPEWPFSPNNPFPRKVTQYRNVPKQSSVIWRQTVKIPKNSDIS